VVTGTTFGNLPNIVAIDLRKCRFNTLRTSFNVICFADKQYPRLAIEIFFNSCEKRRKIRANFSGKFFLENAL